MAFDPVQVTMIPVSGGGLAVSSVTVRWRGREAFSLNTSPPASSDPTMPVGQPFSLGPSRPDPTNPLLFRIADLSFVASTSVWHPCFDACDSLSQAMWVQGGVGLRPLTINLSCTVHPLHLFTQLKRSALDAAAVAALVLFTRRFLRAPGPASTS